MPDIDSVTVRAQPFYKDVPYFRTDQRGIIVQFVIPWFDREEAAKLLLLQSNNLRLTVCKITSDEWAASGGG